MKTENLLIGNGVNLNGSHLFTSKEIIKRIEKTMQFGIDFLLNLDSLNLQLV